MHSYDRQNVPAIITILLAARGFTSQRVLDIAYVPFSCTAHGCHDLGASV